MQRNSVAKKLLVTLAFACLGLATATTTAYGESTVQGSQNSEDSTSTSGGASGTNTNAFNAGPSSTGTGAATSQQNGTNDSSVSQSGEAITGDSVAGGQITGVVADDVTVQNTNNSEDGIARSGIALVTNTAAHTSGPRATSTGGGVATAGQVGSNSYELAQLATTASGDAVANSQVAGIVGDGEHTVQLTNNAECDALCALSGLAFGSNTAFVNVGPSATTTGTATASQVGDNDSILLQANEATSGDALNGSQVTGIVGGSATVQGTNNSDCIGFGRETGCSASGHALALNALTTANAGPTATGGTNATASQVGHNSLDTTQDAHASSGDALSGAQVVGAVGDQGGFLTVQNTNNSEDDVTFSGNALSTNDITTLGAGPEASATGAGSSPSANHVGNNSAAAAQLAASDSGDAVAGGQIVGAVGYHDTTIQQTNNADSPYAESGDPVSINDVGFFIAGPHAIGGGTPTSTAATADQVGDNSLDLTQGIEATSGDAVAGGQVTGVVADGSTVVVQNTNNATDSFGLTGLVLGANNNNADAGPSASGAATLTAQQTGNNSLASAQSIDAASGDAVAGAQVTGVVGDDTTDVTVQNTNNCTFEPFFSETFGEVDVASHESGNCAISLSGGLNAANASVLNAGPNANSTTLATTASANQIGSNDTSSAQGIEASTGDAVAGSQVAGVVAGGEVTVQGTNTSEDAAAVSGDLVVANALTANGGPTAGLAATATSQQSGDNGLTFSQDIEGGTGDAVAGSQVTGIVGPDDSTIQVSNFDHGSASVSGFAVVANTAAGALSPAATGGTTTSQHNGNGTHDGSQHFEVPTGDALSGTQVNGLVGN